MEEKLQNIHRKSMTDGDNRNEKLRNTLIVVTHGGEENATTRDFVARFRNADSVQFVSPDNLPYTPPRGVSEVFISSGSEIRFINETQRQAWSAIQFTRLVHSADATSMTISNGPTERASDFKIAGE